LLFKLQPEKIAPNGDPFGIPMIFPAMIVSIGSLIVVSLLGKKPDPKEWAPLFKDAKEIKAAKEAKAAKSTKQAKPVKKAKK
jgi:hypothetical protein